MKECTHAFVRDDKVRAPLVPPYMGPFEVIKRGPKVFKLLINQKPINITIDRLKPAFIAANLDKFQSILPTTKKKGILIKTNTVYQKKRQVSFSEAPQENNLSTRRSKITDN